MTNQPQMIDAVIGLALMDAIIHISEAINTTNNGKLLICRIDNPAHRDAVPQLIEIGALKRATFMTPGDAVRLP